MFYSYYQQNNNSHNDNRSKQLNPNNDAFWRSRGFEERPSNWKRKDEFEFSFHNDNRSRQLNPNNDTFWRSRGFEKRPSNWKDVKPKKWIEYV